MIDPREELKKIIGEHPVWEQPDWYRSEANKSEALGIPRLYRDADLRDFEDGEVLTYFSFRKDFLPVETIDLMKIAEGPPRNILIVGANGSGKTHLASALAQRWAMFWINMTDLLLKVRATYRPGSSDTERSVLRKYAEVPGLVIDDLTALNRTDFSLSSALYVVTSRLEATAPTIVTTFSTLREISEMESSLASRLAGFLILKTHYDSESGDRRLDW